MKYLLFWASLLFSSLLPAQNQSFELAEISPGIYVHFGNQEPVSRLNHGEIANIGFIVGSKCVAVIDSGGSPQQGYALKKALKATTNVPICYVINTHVHPDHIYGNRAFKKTRAKFVGHYKLPRAMQLRGAYYLARSVEQIGVKLIAEDIIAPDILVKNTLKLDLGGRILTLTAHSTAHTDNDLSILDSRTGTLWLSDLLFIDHIPVVDGSLIGWLNELAKLEKQSFRFVIPGHGPLVTQWPQAMQAEKNYLQLLRDQIRLAIKQGTYLEDAVNTIAVSEKNNWLLFDQFHKKNITTSFAELEWED